MRVLKNIQKNSQNLLKRENLFLKNRKSTVNTKISEKQKLEKEVYELQLLVRKHQKRRENAHETNKKL